MRGKQMNWKSTPIIIYVLEHAKTLDKRRLFGIKCFGVRCTVGKNTKARERGWRSDERTLLPLMWPGFDSRTRRHMWVEFVVGSHPCSERVFSRVLRFSPLLKNQHFQSPIRSRATVSVVRLLRVTLV